jgi:hypothetical protein
MIHLAASLAFSSCSSGVKFFLVLSGTPRALSVPGRFSILSNQAVRRGRDFSETSGIPAQEWLRIQEKTAVSTLLGNALTIWVIVYLVVLL